MKRFAFEFVRRGLVACGFGPMVLAVLYLILERAGAMDMLTVSQVVIGIVSLSALAFIAGGMNAVYQIERLPLMAAVLIHGGVLYASYLAAYLVNGWLKLGSVPVLVFTAIFIVGYFAIWAIIYWVIKKRTKRVNTLLKRKQTEKG
ncbi:MAG: DUF3021 domain-containing protein [Clostridia bacterium]|nr:DUF3021 domain-containing protein [Clostridia bacterium]